MSTTTSSPVPGTTHRAFITDQHAVWSIRPVTPAEVDRGIPAEAVGVVGTGGVTIFVGVEVTGRIERRGPRGTRGFRARFQTVETVTGQVDGRMSVVGAMPTFEPREDATVVTGWVVR